MEQITQETSFHSPLEKYGLKLLCGLVGFSLKAVKAQMLRGLILGMSHVD